MEQEFIATRRLLIGRNNWRIVEQKCVIYAYAVKAKPYWTYKLTFISKVKSRYTSSGEYQVFKLKLNAVYNLLLELVNLYSIKKSEMCKHSSLSKLSSSKIFSVCFGLFVWLVGFYGISTIVGYLTLNPFLRK